jgi:hypothetical protein
LAAPLLQRQRQHRRPPPRLAAPLQQVAASSAPQHRRPRRPLRPRRPRLRHCPNVHTRRSSATDGTGPAVLVFLVLSARLHTARRSAFRTSRARSSGRAPPTSRLSSQGTHRRLRQHHQHRQHRSRRSRRERRQARLAAPLLQRQRQHRRPPPRFGPSRKVCPSFVTGPRFLRLRRSRTLHAGRFGYSSCETPEDYAEWTGDWSGCVGYLASVA